MSSRYYQEGSLERVSRVKGPDVWVYRWSVNRIQRKKVLGNVERLKTKTKAEAKRRSRTSALRSTQSSRRSAA